jgi:protein-S-isoprenylcysteine O-methyltransferase Ste14
MSATLKSSLFDEPDAAEASAPPKRFKFAATFVIDLLVSLAFVAVALPCWAVDFDRGLIMAPTFVIGVLILACYVAKVLVVAYLDKRGGDARTYVKSSALVTDGPYAWSRNPTYALAMLQFLLWAALAFYLLALGPWRWTLAVAAIGLPTLFFLVNDRIVMPTEEAMLRNLHPEAYDAYAARVRRWFGRKAG